MPAVLSRHFFFAFYPILLINKTLVLFNLLVLNITIAGSSGK